LRDMGFKVNPLVRGPVPLEKALDFYRELAGARHDLPYEIDGVVIKVDDIEMQAALGATSRVPRWAVAFKFAAIRETTRVTAIEVLGHLESRRAVPYLLAPHLAQDSSPAVRQAAGEALQSIVGALPSQMDAEHFLLRKATAYYDGQPPLAADQEDNVVLWKWDAAAQRSVPLTLPASDGAAWVAAQLAADLYRLAPGPVEHQRLYLATALEWAKIGGGLDRPLPTGANTVHAAVAQAGVAAVEQVLVDAAPNDHVAAAVGALEVLGAIGDVSLLITPHGRVGPVASALRHTDRRVRFAAAAAIMNIDPHQAYPGSSYLPETLSEFTTVGATPRVLIGHPRQGHGLRVANLLAEMGYVGDAVTSGRELLRLATNRSDYDFVLISDAIDGPAATDVIRQLRRLPAFASVPVGLMGSEATLAGAKRWAVQDPLVDALPLPWESESLALRLRRLEALAGRHVVAHADRLRQARQALMWLAKLADDANAYGHYDLLRRQDTMIAALYEPALAADAAVALGKVGSPKAQTALVEVASLHWHPIAVRQAAHSAFGEAVERRRLLLTTDQILLQYDRYQQSAQLDRETQAVFGAILDTIEAASKTHSGPPQPEEDDAS